MKVIAVCSKKGCAPEKIIEKIDSTTLNEDGLLPIYNITNIQGDIKSEIKKSLYESDKTIILAENNSTTAESFTACSSENPGLILFAASPNLDMLSKLSKLNNLILVGIRKWNAKEIDFLKKNKIKVYPMKEIITEGIFEISDSIMSVSKNFSELYVSIDINVLDPAFAPASSVPGGMSSRELFTFIHRLKNLKNLKIADIICSNPENSVTISVIAKIIAEFY